MQLLTPEAGWALSRGQLFWTASAGAQWRDITPAPASRSGLRPEQRPPESIASVFFLDTSTGWVLLGGSAQSEDERHFELASTMDAGATWSITPVRIPDLDPHEGQGKRFRHLDLAGDARIDFIDTQHGWMNLGLVSGSAFSPGVLLETEDGGATWQWTADSPGVRASVRFVTTKDGWLAGRDALYVTHDGGGSWQGLSLRPPPQVDPAARPGSDLPVFEDRKHAFLPVTYMGSKGEGLALVLYATGDGGLTWKPDRVLTHLAEVYAGLMPSAVVNSSWITVAPSKDRRLTLTAMMRGGKKTATTSQLEYAPSNAVPVELSFADSAHGWVLMSPTGLLLFTSDGGATWTDITPGRAKAHPTAPHRSPPVSQSVPDPATPPSPLTPNAATHTSIHIGFDMCNNRTPSQMGTWWTYSPYFDTGIYLAGAVNSNNCFHPDSGWITQVTSQGWGLMPLWVGPQAPCVDQTSLSTFTSDPGLAFLQGEKEGTSAGNAASSVGLAGTIIYCDLEHYTSSQSSTCASAATAFVFGWVSQLHGDGFVAGVYGGADNANSDWPNVPDDVWIAKHDSRATIWNLGTLNNKLWGVNQRIHQYIGPHSESWAV